MAGARGKQERGRGVRARRGGAAGSPWRESEVVRGGNSGKTVFYNFILLSNAKAYKPRKDNQTDPKTLYTRLRFDRRKLLHSHALF